MKKNTISIYQLFPYEKIQQGEEIILYGLGKIGKRYLNQIEETGYCKVKYIIDQNASAYENFRVPVEEGMAGGSDLTQSYYLNEEETRRKI